MKLLPKRPLADELRNDDGKYQSPGEGNLTLLKIGSQMEFSPGYITTSGNETSSGHVFWLDGWEHISSGGKSSLTLYGIDGWHLLENWRARRQFRWNKDSNEMSVKQILGSLFWPGSALKLEAQSESSIVDRFLSRFYDSSQ